MFFDESYKLERYTYVKTKEITLKKYESLSAPIHFEIFTFSLFGPTKKEKNYHIYIYMYFLPMRLTLCGFITPTWEDVAPEVAVSSVGNTYLQYTLDQVVAHCHHESVIWHRLYVTWTGAPGVEFRLLHTVVVGSFSSGGDYGVHCWWAPIRSKQLFSVPYVACMCLPDFLVMINLIYIYIYIYVCQNVLYSSNLYIYIYIYLPNPPLGQDMTQGQLLSGV